MEKKIVSVGPVTSINSLVYHLSSQFLEIRNDYVHGRRPVFSFDFSDMRGRSISLPALASLLSVGKKLKDFIGYPIPVEMKWDPQVIAILTDSHFIPIAKKLNIFSFSDEFAGTIRMNNEFLNPNTRLLYFGDIKPISDIPPELIGIEKAIHKQKIISNLRIRCANIFKGFDDSLENTLYNTLLELIVNSLMHAQEYAFVALQRTSKSISISVSDAGIGFKKSLFQTFKIPHFKELSNAQAIFIGSLIQKDIHGLRLAIEEVLNFDSESLDDTNEGWVTVSSYDAEIRWQKKNWRKAIKYFDQIDIKNQIPDLSKVLGDPLEKLVDRQVIEDGYYRLYNHFLIGTRISFEIRF